MSGLPRHERSDSSVVDDSIVGPLSSTPRSKPPFRRFTSLHRRPSGHEATSHESPGKWPSGTSDNASMTPPPSSESRADAFPEGKKGALHQQWFSGLGKFVARPEQMEKATRFTLQLIDGRPMTAAGLAGAGTSSSSGGGSRQHLGIGKNFIGSRVGGSPLTDREKPEEFDAFDAMMRGRLDVTETLLARAHQFQVLHGIRVRDATESNPFNTEPLASIALTLAEELVSAERAEEAAAAIRERIELPPHKLEEYFPTPAMVATKGGRRCAVDGSSPLSWRSSPKYSWEVARHVLARCEDKLAHALVVLCAALLLQWGSITAACVAAAVIDSSPIQPRGDIWRRDLVDRCRELVSTLRHAPTRSVEGLMVLLAEAVLQRRVGPKTCDVCCYAPHLNSLFPWVTGLPNTRPILWEAVCVAVECCMPVRVTTVLREKGGAKFRLRIGLGGGTLTADAERSPVTSGDTDETNSDMCTSDDDTSDHDSLAGRMYHMTSLVFDANSSAAWWERPLHGDLTILSEVMVGSSRRRSTHAPYAGSAFLPALKSMPTKSLRKVLAAALGACSQIVGDAQTSTHVLMRAVERLSEGIRDAAGLRNPDFTAFTQMTFNPTGSDGSILPNNQLTAASLSSRKLFSRCQGSFGCLMPWWTKSHAIEYWENRGRRILWVVRQLQIDCPRAFDFARTLLKLYFRTPTMFASLLESCMADLATFCGITIPSDVTKFPSMCDIPQDVIGTCADVSIGGTSNEKEDLAGCVGVMFLVVDAIKRWTSRWEWTDLREGYNYAPLLVREYNLGRMDINFLPIGRGVAHLTSDKVNIFGGTLLSAERTPFVFRLGRSPPKACLGLELVEGLFLEVNLAFQRGKALKMGARGYIRIIGIVNGSKHSMTSPPKDLMTRDGGRVYIPCAWG